MPRMTHGLSLVVRLPAESFQSEVDVLGTVTLPLSGLFMVSFGSIERGGLAMTMTNRIEMNPKVMMGKPVIRGTRIPIELILRKLGEGATEIDLLDAYPRLTKADIQAAIGYAADTVAHEETVLVGSPATRKRAKR